MKNKLTETKFKSALGLTCHLISRALCLGAVMLICSSALAQNPAPLEPGSNSLSHLDSGTWTYTGSLNTVRRSHTATLLPNGMLLVAGGVAFSGPFASAELYDPASGTWTATGSLGTARYLHTTTLLPDGKVLVAGGRSTTITVASAELYDPASGTWTATGSIVIGRSN